MLDSPLIVRTHVNYSYFDSTGSLLTSAAVAPPSPIATAATLPLTASASHMAAGHPPASVTATSETGSVVPAATIVPSSSISVNAAYNVAVLPTTITGTNTTASATASSAASSAQQLPVV